VRIGAKRAMVEAVFDVSSYPKLRAHLNDLGIEAEDGLLILRREVAAAGRNRAWINESPTTARTVGELGRSLVDLHGQHEHQTLLRKDTQRSILDAFGEAEQEATAVVEEFEASLELFARALQSYQIPPARIAHELEAVRSEHYGLLRGRSHPDLRLDTLAHLGIHDAIELNEVEAGAEAVGQSATTLDLRRATGVVQIAVIRRGEPHYLREPDFRYEAGDTAVVVGTREALDRAAELFRTRR